MRPRAKRAKATRAGFTLLELLVALAVFGLAAAALLSLSAENTRLSGHLQARALAGIVAENLGVEAVTATVAPSDGEGIVRLAGRDWRWSRVSHGVADGALLRIDIAVSEANAEGPAAVLTVFRGAD